ncbi:ABC transporter permease [Pseudonocardia oroxyli]|uniref:NitT/TauT family transport system permease protein n=1 Tax=Pseudonocardia oroxyli TaxID=366584 RepID=A0A1G7SPP8_PSEOR|nr:ABC transporter permease [Pseudonocardia oroxyli]SDG25035.1 NitT/TauT family transport system permease protein [Pseudonocardia oroxyli]
MWVSVLVIVSLFVLWELVVRVAHVPQFILPAPTDVFAQVYIKRDALLRNLQPTLVATGEGFGVGVVVGVGLAMLIAGVPLLKAVVYPVVIATQTTPKIALAPLFTLWFGIGLLPKVIIVALLVFFPVFINTAAGLESVSKGRLDLMKSVNASRWAVYRHIRLPEAVPYLFAGLRLALTVAFIGVIVGEWIASGRGLGYLLVLYNSTQDTAALFAVIFVFVFLATVSFYLLGWLENRLSWQVRIQRSQQS